MKEIKETEKETEKGKEREKERERERERKREAKEEDEERRQKGTVLAWPKIERLIFFLATPSTRKRFRCNIYPVVQFNDYKRMMSE